MKPGTKRTDAEALVELWNARHPEGTPVIVHRDSGERFETKTRSAASILPSGEAVIWVEAIAGCYALKRVEPIQGEQ